MKIMKKTVSAALLLLLWTLLLFHGQPVFSASDKSLESLEPLESLESLQNVHFDFDKALIRKDAASVLRRHAEWLRTNMWEKLRIEGHCDERGTREYNLSLGQKRADTVKDFLVTLGVDSERIETVSYGKDRPLLKEHNGYAWAKNRRAAFLLSRSEPTAIIPVSETLEPVETVLVSDFEEESYGEVDYDEVEIKALSDPLEPFNRAMFTVNDKLYFWALKPIAQGYSEIVPEGGRIAVRHFFHNLKTPVRFASALLQGKFKESGLELARFSINTVMGVFGLFDIAEEHFDLEKGDEDVDAVLAAYGVGEGPYIVWPLIGPSSLRSTVGKVGDHFLNPFTYYPDESYVGTGLGIMGYEKVNKTSLQIGEYEDLKKAAVDLYVSVRDAFFQQRHPNEDSKELEMFE